MTSQPQPTRQDAEGLLAADELFESRVLAAMHTTLSSAVIEAMTAMIRDADAGVTIQRATLPTILFAKEILATCATRGVVRKLVERLRAAQPKPAPDAMREALATEIESSKGLYCLDNGGGEHKGYQLGIKKTAAVIAALRSAPVPPAAGASQGLCDTTLTERFVNSACRCKTYKGNLGPCKTFENMGGGVCVYCDHELACHPSPAVAALPLHDLLNQIRDYLDLNSKPENDLARKYSRQITEILVAPPVRGDREREAAIEIAARYLDHLEAGTLPGDADTPSQVAEKLRAILSLPVQSTPDREALAQAYALHRWGEKLENLPDDMKDNCYGFAGQFGGVQSGAGEREQR